MDKLRAVLRWLDERRDWCFDLIRVYLGIGLLVKGALFASDPNLVPSLLHETSGFDAFATILAHYVVIAHLCGGVLLAIGMVTRIAALVQIPILFGAVFFVHFHEGLFTRAQNLEFSLLVLVLLIVMFAHGAGRWSVDHYLFAQDPDAVGDARPRSAG